MVSYFHRIIASHSTRTSKKKDSDLEFVKETLTQYELTVDSAEQPIERPGTHQEQKKFFSGKKKNHTLKNQFIVLPLGEDLVDITVGDPGPKSDIKQFRESLPQFAPNQKFKGDKAYLVHGGVNNPPAVKPKLLVGVEKSA